MYPALEWSLCVAAAVILASICIGNLQHRYAAAFDALAAVEIEDYVGTVLRQAVLLDVVDGLSYDAIILKEQDGEGNLTTLTTNMALVNQLCYEAEEFVTAQITSDDGRAVSIPLGSFTGDGMLEGKGPQIPIFMELGGNVSAAVRQEYAEAGSSQTRHLIIMEIDMPLRAKLSRQTWEGMVTLEILLGEAVLVGTVPRS